MGMETQTDPQQIVRAVKGMSFMVMIVMTMTLKSLCR